MNHIERFYATIERRPVDRPASWLGIPDNTALPKLYEYFGVDNMKDLKARIGDDIYPVEMPYHSPTSDAIYAAFELFFGVTGFAFDNVAHFAHLGGMIFGFLLITYWRKKNNNNGQFYY